MPNRTDMFGVNEFVDESLPSTETELRLGKGDWQSQVEDSVRREALEKTSPLMQLAMLSSYKAIKKAAIRTLRETISAGGGQEHSFAG